MSSIKMEISRYRSYTSYSEENGKLVPAVEPKEQEAKYSVSDNVVIVDLSTGLKWQIGEEKKLKSEVKQNEDTPSKK